MTAMEIKCPKCGKEMEEGFIADYTHGAVLVSKWVEGEPEKSFWLGTKMRGKENMKVKTYRCRGCGYLESYAK
jgi:phage FluMu protein Com